MGLEVWVRGHAEADTSDPMDPSCYFTDCYNELSLANWIARNIDPAARGAWGLAIFTAPEPPLNSSAWRLRLLELATAWARSARALRGKVTEVGYPGDEPRRLAPNETEEYIQECEDLLTFARSVHGRQVEVAVWG